MLVHDWKTFIIKSLRGENSFIRPSTIKAANSKWLAKKLLPIINVDSNVSNEALKTNLDDKVWDKPHLI